MPEPPSVEWIHHWAISAVLIRLLELLSAPTGNIWAMTKPSHSSDAAAVTLNG